MANKITQALLYVAAHGQSFLEQFIPFNKKVHRNYRRFTIEDGVATEDDDRYDPDKDYGNHYTLYQDNMAEDDEVDSDE